MKIVIFVLIGKTFGHLGQSVLLEELYSIKEGKPPEVNLLNEKNNGEAILELFDKNLLNSVHDISAGGLIIALAEMVIPSNYGIKISKPKYLTNSLEYFFGEDQGRYIVEIDKNNMEKVEKILKKNDIFYENIGLTQKVILKFKTKLRLKLKI